VKVSIIKSARTAGNVLAITLVMAGIIALTLTSYLFLVSTQSKIVARSQEWNQAMAVTEAGIEDGMQFVNRFSGTPNVTGWTAGLPADGWTVSGNVYHATRYMDAAHTISYQLYVTNTGLAPIIRSTSYLPAPFWVGTNKAPISRTVVVQAQINAMFQVAMAALGAIDFKGNNVSSDSYDSTDPNYSTNGLYTPLRRKAGGDVATDSTALNVGNANIAGKARTGPGGTVSFNKNNSTIGDLTWVNASTPGAEPGWTTDDMNMQFNDVVLPAVSWGYAGGTGTGGSGTAPDGNTYDHVFSDSINDTALNPGNFIITDSGTVYVGTNVHVNLQITASSWNPSTVYVAGMTTNEIGIAKFYMNGTTSMGLSQTVSAQSGRPVALQFYGLPSLTSIKFSGNGNWSGTIYAPEASFQLSGGGNDTQDFAGSCVVHDIQMNGHYNFHFDESLKNMSIDLQYKAISWREL
jgi:hypothetical protein